MVELSRVLMLDETILKWGPDFERQMQAPLT